MEADVPANLTPQYFEAERRYKEARTSAEKIKALRGMLAIMPKHKGTEKLQADLRRKLSKLQEEIEAEHHAHRGGAHGGLGHVKREGAGQVVLVGAPNAGKSSLVAALTHAHPKVAPYPFTTHDPLAGMMSFEDVQVQLVDTPAVSVDYFESWMPELVRNSDRVLWVADLGSDALLEDIDAVVRALASHELRLRAAGHADIAPGNGVLETLVAAGKLDAPGAADRLELLRDEVHEVVGGDVPILAVSAESGEGLETLRRTVYESLRVIRVYTKIPGHKPDHDRPFVLPRGATVLDLARAVHRDIAASLQFARLWGSSRFEGQTVQQDQPLQDGDVVELHAG
jgi:hypothetical protein